MSTFAKPAQFLTSYQKVNFDFGRSVYLYRVDTAGKTAKVDVHKELRVPRATKTMLMEKFARDHQIPHFIYDGEQKFFVPKKLSSELTEVGLLLGFFSFLFFQLHLLFTLLGRDQVGKQGRDFDAESPLCERDPFGDVEFRRVL